MGVVHKLKSEVIDFILQTKKNQPRISVRKLAEITSQTFQTRISKSSINNVLKEFALSSPVGRPSRKKKEKIFTIPQEAKARIRQEIQKVGLSPMDDLQNSSGIQSVYASENVSTEIETGNGAPAIRPEDSAISSFSESGTPWESVTQEDSGLAIFPEDKRNISSEPQKSAAAGEEIPFLELPQSTDVTISESVISDDQFALSAEATESNELEKDTVESGLRLRPDPLAETHTIINPDRDGGAPGPEAGLIKPYDKREKNVDLSNEKPVAGAVILYVVAQALTHKSFFAQLLEDVKWSQDFSAFEPLCHAEIIYQWLEKICGVVPEVVDKSPVWQVLGFSEPQDRKFFQKKLTEFQVDDFFRIKYLTERDQLDIEVSGYRVTLREGGAFCVDALNQALSLHLGKSVRGRPLNLAVCDLSRQIISNLRPLLIHHLTIQENALIALRHLCLAFCSSVKNPWVKEVFLLNSQGDEMAVFEMVASIPRKFLIGLPQADPLFIQNRSFLGGMIISETDMAVDGQIFRCTIRAFEASKIFSEGGLDTALFTGEEFKSLKIIDMEDCKAQRNWFLTNCDNQAIPDLLENYARRWQNLTGKSVDSGLQTSQNKTEPVGFLDAELRDLADIFVHFGQYLVDKLGHWLFFGTGSTDEQTALLRTICLLPGQVEEQNRQNILWLNTRKLAPEIKEKILIIFTRFNQHEFVDYKGRYFYIKTY